MKRALIVMSLMAFAFMAKAQTGTTNEVKQAAPVMKVDGANNSDTQTTQTDSSTEKKACCQKGAEEGKACCKDGTKGECKHHDAKGGKGKACCKKAAKAGKTCEHHSSASGKSCNQGSSTPAKTCPHSEGTK